MFKNNYEKVVHPTLEELRGDTRVPRVQHHAEVQRNEFRMSYRIGGIQTDVS